MSEITIRKHRVEQISSFFSFGPDMGCIMIRSLFFVSSGARATAVPEFRRLTKCAWDKSVTEFPDCDESNVQ